MSINDVALYLVKEEKERLLQQPNPRYPTGERNFLIISLILATGIRLSELINLKWEDVCWSSNDLLVRGKTSKRKIGLENAILSLLQKWKKRQQDIVGNQPELVFTTLKGTPLNSRYIQQMLKRYAGRASISKNVSPKTLRYTYAVNLYKDQNNLEVLSDKMGLSGPVAIKIHNFINELRKDESPNAYKENSQMKINNESNNIKSSKKHEPYSLSMYAIKCSCGEIVVKNMRFCPGCKLEVEKIVNNYKNSFNRINWGSKE